MTSSAQALNREYGLLKQAVTSFDKTTSVVKVDETKKALENLQGRIKEVVGKNAQAMMALALPLSTIPKLLKTCETLIPSDYVRTETTQQTPTISAPSNQVQKSVTPVVKKEESKSPSETTETTHTVGLIKLTHPTTERPKFKEGARKPPTLRRGTTVASTTTVVVETPKPPVTEIRVKCKVPFGHTVTIRGQGGDLDWSRGKALEKIDEETYVCRFEGLTGKVEYKLLLDDKVWEGFNGNRTIEAEKTTDVAPVLTFPKVAVVVNLDVPSDTKLFVRGTAKGMSWEKGTELKSVNGKFVLESDADLGNFEFKVLRNDQQWSQGENFKAVSGQTLEISPKF